MANILVTRPEPQAQETAGWLVKAGHHAIISPVIQLSETTDCTRKIVGARHKDVLIVTSQKALSLLVQYGMQRDMPLLLTGAALAAKAMHDGFTQVRHANNNAQSLLDMILADVSLRTQYLGYMHGSPIALDMVGHLHQADFNIEGFEIYQSCMAGKLRSEALQALQGGEVDCILCYSNVSAQSLMQLARQHALHITQTAICTISASITAYLQESGCVNVLTASSPAPDNILQMLDTLEESR